MASLLCEDVVTPDDSQQGIITSGSSTNLGSDMSVGIIRTTNANRINVLFYKMTWALISSNLFTDHTSGCLSRQKRMICIIGLLGFLIASIVVAGVLATRVQPGNLFSTVRHPLASLDSDSLREVFKRKNWDRIMLCATQA